MCRGHRNDNLRSQSLSLTTDSFTCFEDNGDMEDPKKNQPTATEEYEKKPADDKNLDRDGGERQPVDQKQEPSK